MEKDYNLMMKCRAIFIRSIAVILDGNYPYDSRFELLLKYFFDSYVYNIEDVFKIIYDVRTNEDGSKYIYEDEDMKKLFFKYLIESNSNYRLGIMCEEVGQDNVNIISSLAELFYEYVLVINEVNSNKNRILN